MSSIKCPDSEIVLFFCWCLCEMSWQNGCCRNNAFLCLPSQVINVLSSQRDFLPSADSANRRSEKTHTFSCDRGRQSFLGLPFFCDTNAQRRSLSVCVLLRLLAKDTCRLRCWASQLQWRGRKSRMGNVSTIKYPVGRWLLQQGLCFGTSLETKH